MPVKTVLHVTDFSIDCQLRTFCRCSRKDLLIWQLQQSMELARANFPSYVSLTNYSTRRMLTLSAPSKGIFSNSNVVKMSFKPLWNGLQTLQIDI